MRKASPNFSIINFCPLLIIFLNAPMVKAYFLSTTQVLTEEDAERIRSGQCLQSDQIGLAVQLIKQQYPHNRDYCAPFSCKDQTNCPNYRQTASKYTMWQETTGSVRRTAGPISNSSIVCIMDGSQLIFALNFRLFT